MVRISVYTVPTVKKGNKRYIDIKEIKALIDLENEFYKDDTIKEEIKEETPEVLFRRQFNLIWWDCLPKKGKTTNQCLGSTSKVKYLYDEDSLKEHREEIKDLLLQVSNAQTFKEIGALNTGVPWAKSPNEIHRLLSLVDALGKVNTKTIGENLTLKRTSC